MSAAPSSDPLSTTSAAEGQTYGWITRIVRRDDSFIGPRDPIEAEVTRIWEDVLRVRPIGIRDHFLDLGGDPQTAAHLIRSTQQKFRKEIPPGALLQSPTVEQFAARLRQERARDRWSSLVRLQEGQGPKAVFCFLFAGGFKNEIFSFAALAPRIGLEYSFYGVIARGTDGVSQPYDTVEQMAAAYIKEIKAVQPSGPYFLLGECFSATVAYETARQLRENGDRVGLLGLLDGRVHYRWYYKFLGARLGARVADQMVAVRQSKVGAYLTNGVPFHLKRLRTLRVADRVRYVKKVMTASRLRKPEGAAPANPPAIEKTTAPDPTPSRRAKDLERASLSYHLAVRRYRYRPYSSRITVIANEEWCKSGAVLGWISPEVVIHRIPGNHDTYLRDHMQTVADLLRAALKRAR